MRSGSSDKRGVEPVAQEEPKVKLEGRHAQGLSARCRECVSPVPHC